MMKKRRMRDYSTDYTYGYTTGYLGMWLMPTKGGERTSPEDDGEEDKDNERTTEQRYATPDTLQIRHARYARYATPDTLQIRLIHLIRLIRLIRLCETIGELFQNEGRGMIIYDIICVAPVYSIPIPMVLCCIYISHIVLPVLFVLFSILTLCDPV